MSPYSLVLGTQSLKMVLQKCKINVILNLAHNIILGQFLQFLQIIKC